MSVFHVFKIIGTKSHKALQILSDPQIIPCTIGLGLLRNKKNTRIMDKKKNLFKKVFESYMSGSWSIQKGDDDHDDKLFSEFCEMVEQQKCI